LANWTAANIAPTTNANWAGSTILVSGEIRVDAFDDGRCREPGDGDERGDADHQPPHDGGEPAPTLRLLVVGEVSREDRDEGDREEPAGEQVVGEIGDPERGDVLVGPGVGAEHAGEDHLA
jgi:hypothetical protein